MRPITRIKSINSKEIHHSRKYNSNRKIAYLKYRDIAIEFIKQGYNNIRGIYHKFYPNINGKSLDVLPYRLLDNVRFQEILQEVWEEIKIEDFDLAKEVALCLRKEMYQAKNASDRITAASWLGKKEAMFTDKSEVSTIEKEDSQFSLERISRIRQADKQ